MSLWRNGKGCIHHRWVVSRDDDSECYTRVSWPFNKFFLDSYVYICGWKSGPKKYTDLVDAVMFKGHMDGGAIWWIVLVGGVRYLRGQSRKSRNMNKDMEINMVKFERIVTDWSMNCSN